MPPSPTRIGLQIPYFNLPGVGPAGLLDKLTEIATTAEASGFDSVWVMDHLNQIPGVGTMDEWMLEGNTVLAALAARTKSVSLGLMVGGVTYRNPAFMAKVTSTIDVLSGGRAVLGIGAAWFEAEHVAFGYPFPPLKERFERLEEALQIFRAMFTQDQPSFSGEYYSIEKIHNNPPPIRGDIPIMIGGSGEKKTLRMVAQYADGSNMFGDVDRIRHLVGVLEDHCANHDRDPSEITKTRLGTLILHDTADSAIKAKEERLAGHPDPARAGAMMSAGDPDTIGEEIQGYLDAGLDGLIFNMPEVYDLDQVARAGELLKKVIPAAS
jgi:F420-dependent oxidoreductase-like protein